MKNNRLHNFFGRTEWTPAAACAEPGRCSGNGYLIHGSEARPCGCALGRQLRAEGLARRSGIPRGAFAWAPLEITSGRFGKILERIEIYGRNFIPGTSSGALLLGPPGSGKSRLASGLGAYIAEERRGRVRWEDWPAFLRKVRRTYGPGARETEEDMIESVLGADLLILDDIGAESAPEGSSWAESILCDILSRAISAQAPAVVVTSNLSDKEICTRYGDRVHGRLAEVSSGRGGGFVAIFAGVENFRALLVEEVL